MTTPSRLALCAAALLLAVPAGCSTEATTPDSVPVETSNPADSVIADKASLLAMLDGAGATSIGCTHQWAGSNVSSFGREGSFGFRNNGMNVAFADGSKVFVRVYEASGLSAEAREVLGRYEDAWLTATMDDAVRALDLETLPSRCIPDDVEFTEISSTDGPEGNFIAVSPDGSRGGKGYFDRGRVQFEVHDESYEIVLNPSYPTRPIGIPSSVDITGAVEIAAEDMAVLAPLPAGE